MDFEVRETVFEAQVFLFYSSSKFFLAIYYLYCARYLKCIDKVLPCLLNECLVLLKEPYYTSGSLPERCLLTSSVTYSLLYNFEN